MWESREKKFVLCRNSCHDHPKEKLLRFVHMNKLDELPSIRLNSGTTTTTQLVNPTWRMGKNILFAVKALLVLWLTNWCPGLYWNVSPCASIRPSSRQETLSWIIINGRAIKSWNTSNRRLIFNVQWKNGRIIISLGKLLSDPVNTHSESLASNQLLIHEQRAICKELDG